MEALSFKSRMRTYTGTSPSPMITRTYRNCITVMIIRSREEHGVDPVSRRAASVPPNVDTCLSNT
jgi:hypothetical protein